MNWAGLGILELVTAVKAGLVTPVELVHERQGLNLAQNDICRLVRAIRDGQI